MACLGGGLRPPSAFNVSNGVILLACVSGVALLHVSCECFIFVRSFVRSFVHSFIHSLTHSLTHSSTHPYPLIQIVDSDYRNKR